MGHGLTLPVMEGSCGGVLRRVYGKVIQQTPSYGRLCTPTVYQKRRTYNNYRPFRKYYHGVAIWAVAFGSIDMTLKVLFAQRFKRGWLMAQFLTGKIQVHKHSLRHCSYGGTGLVL